MEGTLRILVGIAAFKPDRRFLQSLPYFSRDVQKNLPNVHLEFCWVWNKSLVDAQNEFAETLLSDRYGYDYLLTIEDDHWGFTWQMLETCIKANRHVAGIPYRSRHFPFEVVPMKLIKVDDKGVRKFSGLNNPEYNSYEEADLLGFGFTLIRSDVFRILDRPYFRLNIESFKGNIGPHATDIDFCKRLQDKGINPVGCFQHRLNHRDLTEEGYKSMLVEGILTQHSMFTTIENIGRYKKVQESFNKSRRENEKLKENQ